MRERLTDHLGLKLVSLVLGFSLWYAVSREQEAEFSVVIPIELRDLPEGLEVIEESVQQVDVRLRGPAEILRRLTPQEVNIGVDLSDAEPGERLAYLAPRDVAAPFAARVMRVTPTSVRIVLDRTMERKVEVIARVVGSPPEGYELYEIALAPNELEVVGPSSRLEGLEQVTTEPVSADGLREPYSRLVRVELDPLVRLERETTVALTLDVREETLRREITGVRVKSLPADREARVTPGSVRVTVEGPKGAVSELSADQFEAEVSIEGLSAGRHSLPPTVRLSSPERASIQILSIEPASLRVHVQ
ncbi:MAG: CdaR family protein [Vicinamibacteria bacterium]